MKVLCREKEMKKRKVNGRKKKKQSRAKVLAYHNKVMSRMMKN